MKCALLLLFLSAIPLVASDEWPGFKFVEVRAFSWPVSGLEDRRELIREDRSIAPGVINPQGALLSHEETSKLLGAVNGQHPDYTRALCYLPHNAFVFYDAAGRPVAFLEICFSCLRKRSDPAAVVTNFDLPAMASIFAAHKLPFGGSPDLKTFTEVFASHVADRRSSGE